MKDLIEALQIFAKYTNDLYPTWCEHDELYVRVNPEDVDTHDWHKLEQLGFIDMDDCFVSYRFGSS